MGVTQTQAAVAAQRPEYPVVRIEARRGWLALDLGELWAYRDLVYFFVWRDIKVRYKQTAIGAAWAILQPVLTMLVFSLFFGKLAKIPSQGLPYPIFYYSALLPWMYFATAMQSATNVVVEQQRVITKIYFPRLVLPIAAVLAGLLDFAISFAVFLVLMAYYRIAPTGAVLWLPLLPPAGRVDRSGGRPVALRPQRHLPRRPLRGAFLVQFWLFASPVAYPSCLVPENWRWLYGLNPMAGVIEGFRWALTGHGQPPDSAGRSRLPWCCCLERAGLLPCHGRNHRGRGLNHE